MQGNIFPTSSNPPGGNIDGGEGGMEEGGRGTAGGVISHER